MSDDYIVLDVWPFMVTKISFVVLCPDALSLLLPLSAPAK